MEPGKLAGKMEGLEDSWSEDRPGPDFEDIDEMKDEMSSRSYETKMPSTFYMTKELEREEMISR